MVENYRIDAKFHCSERKFFSFNNVASLDSLELIDLEGNKVRNLFESCTKRKCSFSKVRASKIKQDAFMKTLYPQLILCSKCNMRYLNSSIISHLNDFHAYLDCEPYTFPRID